MLDTPPRIVYNQGNTRRPRPAGRKTGTILQEV